MEQFKKSLERFQLAVNYIRKHKVDLNKKIDPTKSIYDFKEKKLDYYLRLYHSSFDEVKNNSLNLNQLNKEDVTKINKFLNELEEEYKNNDLDKISKILNELISLKLLLKQTENKLSIKIKNIPDDIRADVKADLKELENCFNAECYRSCIILCGRLLETALHRKYYDVTGMDILEKNPGIGLGNLIAKLKDKNVILDPALTNQIHLINQVRIFSVHKKKETFYPSKSQTYAIILYTLDVLEKIFGKG